MLRIGFIFPCALMCCAFFSGCGTNNSDKVHVLCTTGMISDVVKNIAGETLKIHTVMSAGVDPHLYRPTHRDMKLLKTAEVVFYNGLHLEGRMQEVLEIQKKKQRKVFAVSEGLPHDKVIVSAAFVTAEDPHIWHDVSNWVAVSHYVAKVLSEIYPEHRDAYHKNLKVFVGRLSELHQWIGQKLETLPSQSKYLVTTHDAFSYYSRAYGLKVKTLLGVSTQAEYGLKDVEEMVRFVVDHNVKAVFFESSVSSKALESIVEGCAALGSDISIGGKLYSDALGTSGRPEGTYIGMMKQNTLTILAALK